MRLTAGADCRAVSLVFVAFVANGASQFDGSHAGYPSWAVAAPAMVARPSFYWRAGAITVTIDLCPRDHLCAHVKGMTTTRPEGVYLGPCLSEGTAKRLGFNIFNTEAAGAAMPRLADLSCTAIENEIDGRYEFFGSLAAHRGDYRTGGSGTLGGSTLRDQFRKTIGKAVGSRSGIYRRGDGCHRAISGGHNCPMGVGLPGAAQDAGP